MYFDWTYIVLVLPCVLLSLWASNSVNSTFKKYSSQMSRRGISGAQAAERVLRSNGVSGVRIERTAGNLTDHYDPRTNVIRLSDPVYSSTSVAAVGVACHEAGHAVQYAQNYAPIKLRAAIIPITNIGSKLAWPIILLGVLINSESSQMIINAGIILFSFAVIFQLVTLPVEFDASKRALYMLENQRILRETEVPHARKVLSAAALTYVASAAAAILQLLRVVILFGGRRRDD